MADMPAPVNPGVALEVLVQRAGADFFDIKFRGQIVIQLEATEIVGKISKPSEFRRAMAWRTNRP